MKNYLKNMSAKIQYNDYYKPYKDNMVRLMEHYVSRGVRIATWGYGLKGESFLNVMDAEKKYVSCVVDSNKELHGKKTSTKHDVISCKELERYGVGLVLIMNKVYFNDIARMLDCEGYDAELIDVDELVENNVPYRTILEGRAYEKKRDVSYDMEKLQKHALEILCEVDRICKRHDIHYFLSAGTALGAIRHQGFIPWDEDVDIGMFRKEYDRFRDIVKKELGERFYFQYLEEGRDFFLPFCQIVKNNTSYVRLELSKAKMHHGLHVDVFPFDNVSSNPLMREKQVKMVSKYRNLLLWKLVKNPYESQSPIKNLIVNYKYYALKLLGFRHLKRKMEQALTLYKDKETGYVADLCTHYKKTMYFKKEDIIPTKTALFEKLPFPVPNNHDAYLKTMYGDYMTPPPEGKRFQKCRLVEVSCERNYHLDDDWMEEKDG